MINLIDLQLNELEELMKELGQPKFRAAQVFSWLYKEAGKGAADFNDMTNIPKMIREKLSEISTIGLPEILKVQESKLDGTRKYLFGLADGNGVESVFMRYKFGNSICVSSQAGCRMGCSFCASTLGGLERNLTAGEIAGQILSAERDTGERISHVVVMGSGEPFDNYENLSGFIRIINDPKGLNIGMRNITVSTCGIVPMIERFGEDFPQVNLAISLHAFTTYTPAASCVASIFALPPRAVACAAREPLAAYTSSSSVEIEHIHLAVLRHHRAGNSTKEKGC